MTHALKTWKTYYSDVHSGLKNFELRKADRPFKVGDTLLLQEWDNTKDEYTGKELKREIMFILINVEGLGLKEGYVIMGLKELEIY